MQMTKYSGDADQVADLLHHDIGGLLLVSGLRGDDGALARAEKVGLLTSVHIHALIDGGVVVHCLVHLLPFASFAAARSRARAT